MEIRDLVAILTLAGTILGVAITLGRFYQRQNDLIGKVKDVEKDLATTIAGSVADGKSIARLEAQYAQIISTLAEIKADVRIVIKGQ